MIENKITWKKVNSLHEMSLNNGLQGLILWANPEPNEHYTLTIFSEEEKSFFKAPCSCNKKMESWNQYYISIPYFKLVDVDKMETTE